MDEFVSVYVAQSEGEAVSLCALLESAGIEAMHRLTNTGAGALGAVGSAAPQEILVRPEDADDARQILESDNE
jgi:Putative prokaryotic signal transducing protein